MAKCTKTMDKHRWHSASTAAVCIGAAEKCAHCCEVLGTAKRSSETKKKMYNKTLRKCDNTIIAVFRNFYFTEVRLEPTAAYSAAVALFVKKLNLLE